MPESKHFLQIMILEEDMHGEKSRQDLFMSSRALKFQKLSWMSEQSEPWWLPPHPPSSYAAVAMPLVWEKTAARSHLSPERLANERNLPL